MNNEQISAKLAYLFMKAFARGDYTAAAVYDRECLIYERSES